MIHCHKCEAVNPPETNVCQQCGANLLPGEGIADRAGNLIAGVIAAAIAFGLAYLTSKMPADLPECLPTSPAVWLLIGVVAFISSVISVFRKTPLHARYTTRARRHIERDPEQAVADFGKALELAPEKMRAGLLKERAQIYQKLSLEREATRDLLDYTFEEGAFETGAGLARMVGADRDAYKSSAAESERSQMIAEGKVKALGYCTKCEAVVELTPKLRCPIHKSPKPKEVQYCLPDEVDPTKAKVLEAYVKSSRTSKKWKLGCGLGLGVFMFLCVLPTVIAGLTRKDRIATSTPTVPAPSSLPTSTRRVELPTLTPEAFNPFADGQVACIASDPYGLTCLGSSGWQNYPAERLRYWDLDRMTVCPDGRLVTGCYAGIGLFNGVNWIDHEIGDFGNGERVACDASGGIWAIHYQGVSRFDGSDWTSYPSNLLGSGEYVDLLRDIAISPDGLVWVVTNDSIASFDGQGWRVFEQGQGFEEDYQIDHIVVDSQNRVWATDGLILLRYDGTTWEEVEHPHSFVITELAIDIRDRVWVCGYGGVSALDQGVWTTYTEKNSNLSSDRVDALAVDGRGRVWAGTEWGLNVLDGEQWLTYHMHNSELLDNRIEHILVVGEGPDLPTQEEKPTGSISGVVTQDGLPWGNMGVEVCVEGLGYAYYYGATPCDGQPFLRRSTTDADGKFLIPDLPTGRYILVFQLGDTTWDEWNDPKGHWGRVLVKPGQETVVSVR